MKNLIFYASSLWLGLSLFSPAQSVQTTERFAIGNQKNIVEPTIAQYDQPGYEPYYNSRFNFSVQYPSELLTPLSPPANKDGRSFISPDRDIRMVVYGRHQNDQSLETYYQSHLDSYDVRGAEVTYAYLGDDEFVISGYTPSGNVFYRKTLLRNEDFLVLGITYDRPLQAEFDPIVATISDSFSAGDGAAAVNRAGAIPTATKETPAYEPPSNLRQVQIYFPQAGTDIFSEVAPVTRMTDRVDVIEYTVEELLAGPNEVEADRVDALPIQPVGESVCEGQTFTVDLIQGTVIVRFCRDIVLGGIGDSVSTEQAIRSTLTQFATVTEVVVLGSNGECFFDARGNNECFNQLPARYINTP